MERDPNILEVDSVVMSYGTNRLLSDIYLKCTQGSITGLLGRNGSGKSSLLRIIFGVLSADNASVRINGRVVTGSSLGDRLIGYLPQHHFIPASMKVSQALSMCDVDEDMACKVFPEIEKSLAARPDQLSGGERRLIEILLVLYSKNLFCLLDEPFSGLSPVMIERVSGWIRQAKESKGILITDHLHRDVTRLSDALYVLVDGQSRALLRAGDLIRYGYLKDNDAL